MGFRKIGNESTMTNNNCEKRIKYLKKLIIYYLNELKDAEEIKVKYIRPRLFKALKNYDFLKKEMNQQ